MSISKISTPTSYIYLPLTIEIHIIFTFESANSFSFHGGYIKESMCFNVTFFEKDSELREIHFPV